MLHPIGELASNQTIEADICIAGAGPAGIALSLTLSRMGISSVVLEAGPDGNPSDQQKDPYRGTNLGLQYPIEASRLRYFGGSSNHWGGWCKPLDPIDFSRRHGAPLPSWPITPAELEPYYPAALEWCEIPEADFVPDSSVANPEADFMLRGDDEFMTRIFRFSPPTRFGARYGTQIAEDPRINCILNASLTAMEHEGDRITMATAQNLQGDSVKVRAKQFVLAMGGIETTRFLLHLAESTGARFGTQSGLLGACFMDHFGFHPGYLVASPNLKYHRHTHQDEPVMPVLTATPDLQESSDLPSICLMTAPDSPSGELPPDYFTNPGILQPGNSSDALRYRLQLICEPTAHTGSRITLGQERDSFGMKRTVLDWRILDEDYVKVEEFMFRFERAVGRAGQGRVQRTRRFVDELRSTLSVGMHHMGSTRMSDDPKYGVVDTDCRVFGSANLFVASSSVFPRVGYTNPTLAILALTDRLAQHINGAGA